MTQYRRFNAEFRGGDHNENDWEWCVIDEELGLVGGAVLFDLEEHQAKSVADYLERLIVNND